MNVGFIGLGCEKNTVNTEMMIAACRNRGYQIVHELEKTQVVVTNTCGFNRERKAGGAGNHF